MKKTRSIFLLIVVIVLLLAVGTGVRYYDKNNETVQSTPHTVNTNIMSYTGNIVEQTQANTNFRKVLFTGTRSQLVAMSIPPGGEVGDETHTYTEQTLFFLSGTGESILNGKISPIGPGDVVVVVPGTEHNFKNTGTVPLKIYTVYAPPNHIDGTIEATKADADANVQDEEFGNQPR